MVIYPPIDKNIQIAQYTVPGIFNDRILKLNQDHLLQGP